MFTLSTRLTILTLVVILTGAIISGKANQSSEARGKTADLAAATSIKPVLSSNGNIGTKSDLGILIGATAWGIYTSNGISIAGYNENKRWPIASLTKLMTALVARDVIAPTEKITINNIEPETEGYAGNFSVGEIYSERDMEKALLMASSNVAGDAMASHYGFQKFIDTMNSYAAKIGMLNTHFNDPTGLSYQDQSTVGDLDKLVTYILLNQSDLFKITRLTRASIYDYQSGRRRSMSNINEFAGKADFIGGKTGTTPVAIQNLIGIFNGASGTPDKVVILLGTEDRYNEANIILEKWNHK